MKPAELAQARGELVAFAAEVLAPLPRSDQRRWGETYLRGLMLDGRRKSIEPMAARLADGDEQALQQFVNQSPWEWEPVRERLATRMQEAIEPLAWIIDDTGFPKAGRYSVGVARQYSGTLGKVGNCQIGVSVSAASEVAQLPTHVAPLPAARLGRGCPASRQGASAGEGAPPTEVAAGLGDAHELRGGLAALPIVADAGYGEITAFRAALEERELAYVVEVKAATSAYAPQVAAEQPPWRWPRAPHPAARYRQPPASLRALALAAGSTAAWPGARARAARWRRASWRCACVPPTSACAVLIARHCRSPGCSASGPKAPPSRASTGWPTCPRRRRLGIWCAWPSCAGASSKIIVSSRTPWVSITSRVPPRLAPSRHARLAHGFLTLQRLNPKADAPASRCSPPCASCSG